MPKNKKKPAKARKSVEKKKIKDFHVSPINLGKKKPEKFKANFKKIKIPLGGKNLEEEVDKIKSSPTNEDLEKSSENEIDETISDIGFQQFLQPLIPRKTVPVLERVAVAQSQELEQQLANVAIQRRENEEERGIKYGETKADYGTATENGRRERVKYETETPKYGVRGEKKEDENRIVGQRLRGEWKEINKEERWQTEGQKSIEETPEKKYLEKGQY